MKIKKINSEIFNKIQQINYFLFVLVFFFNSGLILMINEVNINNIFFVIGNFIIICFFLFINKIYTKEFLKNQKELDKLLKLDKN
jgi:Kef-type K+ transport system membrane component KefB